MTRLLFFFEVFSIFLQFSDFSLILDPTYNVVCFSKCPQFLALVVQFWFRKRYPYDNFSNKIIYTALCYDRGVRIDPTDEICVWLGTSASRINRRGTATGTMMMMNIIIISTNLLAQYIIQGLPLRYTSMFV